MLVVLLVFRLSDNCTATADGRHNYFCCNEIRDESHAASYCCCSSSTAVTEPGATINIIQPILTTQHC
eukprot:787-Heterococcus_DN1.PRE.2